MKRTVETFLRSVGRRGDHLGLTAITGFLAALGDPQKKLTVIQVAGTNGKGSICCFLAEILHLSGYRTGVFNSPGVFSEYERYRVDGIEISEREYEAVFERLMPLYLEFERDGKPLPTIFELETIASILFFIEKDCDYCIYEAGMGGDLDATNIFDRQCLAIISSIDFDHMQFLGNTLAEIAGHKAGIFKKDGHAVSAPQSEEAAKVLYSRASEISCELDFSDPSEFPCELTMEGRWQKLNASVVYTAVSALKRQGLHISDAAISGGFMKAVWPGRMEKISDKPVVYLDGAHNTAAFLQLAGELDENPQLKDREICLLIGVFSDKEIDKMLSLLLPKVADIICVSTEGERAVPAEQLCRICHDKGFLRAEAADTYEEGVRMALQSKDTAILCTGSLSILGKMRSLFEKDLKIC